MSPLTIAVIRVNNDGRPDFASNPFNGPLPTYEQALQRFCNVNNRPGCLLRDLQEQAPIPDYCARHAQLADVDRRAASVRNARGGRHQLRQRPQPRREVDPGQRQHHVRPGHRRSISVFERRATRVPDLRGGWNDSAHRPVRLPRTADERHQAHERQLAGVADLHAGGPLGSGSAADQRIHGSAFPCGQGSRRRALACRGRSAASPGVQRHLGSGRQASR